MRVVIAHSRYLSAASGENQVVDDEARLLEQNGHDVTRWEPSPEPDGRVALLKTGVGAVWSTSAARRLRDLVRNEQPDVLHCHNLFPTLSPAVLRVASDEQLPVVVTLHNYRMLCLPANFLRDGRVCEDCAGHVPWRGVVRGCYRDSRLGSAALSTSLTLHRSIRTFDRPQLFLAVSEFVRRKHIDAGWRPERIRVKANFSWPCARRSAIGESFLFVGRLSEEKGLAHLLRAWRGVDHPLVVVGDGPEADAMHELAPSNVEFTGSLPRDEVDAMLRQTRALIVPSICFEGQPRTILEAYAAGVPVVASRIGGLPELVLDGESGYLVDTDDDDAWRAAIARLADDDVVEELGARAFELWRDRYSPDAGIDALTRAYGDAINGGPR